MERINTKKATKSPARILQLHNKQQSRSLSKPEHTRTNVLSKKHAWIPELR